MRLFRTFALAFGIVLFVGVAFLAGYLIGDRHGQRASAQISSLETLYRVRDLLNREFLGDAPTAQAQAYGATHGLVQAFNDPFTVFVEPAPRKLEKAELEGQFGGIGALVQRNQANEAILIPNRDSPAQRAGILEGDILVAVDGQTIIPQMTVEQIVLLVRGDIGTKVTLTLRRSDRPAPFDVTVTRDRIETPSVNWRVLDTSQHLGYVRISVFSERTSQELQEGLADLADKGVNKLVLDLRGNGGGLLTAAIDTASQFVSDGIVLRETTRDNGEKTYPVNHSSGPGQKWPIALLTDGGTASASEIVAGALRDYGRATLVGEKTYGKGSVQMVYELADGSSLHVTVARWKTPNGSLIDKVGLQPDISVGISADERNAGHDTQLARAQAWLTDSEQAALPGTPTTP